MLLHDALLASMAATAPTELSFHSIEFEAHMKRNQQSLIGNGLSIYLTNVLHLFSDAFEQIKLHTLDFFFISPHSV